MKIKEEIMSTLKTVMISSLVLAAFYAVQVQAQSYTPPGGNVPGPLTTGAGTQTKASGDLQLAGGGSLWAGGNVNVGSNVNASVVYAATGVCINGDCRTSWPGAGGTSVYVCPQYCQRWGSAPFLSTQASCNNNYDYSGACTYIGKLVP